MKKVEAYIRHEAFEPIRRSCSSSGSPRSRSSEVKGSGRQKGIIERYRGAELTNYLRPKVKIECVVATSDVETVVDTILQARPHRARSATARCSSSPVEQAYRDPDRRVR